MNVLITGSSKGIGRAAAIKFLTEGHKVFGIDLLEDSISCRKSGFSEIDSGDIAEGGNYVHFVADICKKETLPDIADIEILVNNAGIQSGTENDVKVNLLGTMNVTEKYAFQNSIKSVLFNSSVSALTGNEFSFYVASKAGVNGYMKNCAIKLANEFKATCNSLCFGGVLTELNAPVMENSKLWEKIMDVTPLKRWMTSEEAADWCYFMTVTNKFCTGQAIEISGGERNCADLFVWAE